MSQLPDAIVSITGFERKEKGQAKTAKKSCDTSSVEDCFPCNSCPSQQLVVLLLLTLLLVTDQKHKIEDAHELLLQGLRDRLACFRSVNLCNFLAHGLVEVKNFLLSLDPKYNLRHVLTLPSSSPL